MHDSIKQMLNNYHCSAKQDYINAIKEIFQQIALLGLWRAKFFEKAAFYGGSALRILYGLDRFSEDLDFSLLKTDKSFTLEPYNIAITKELAGFGFDAKVMSKIKSGESNIESAFIKAGTKQQLITIAAPNDIVRNIHDMQNIKIKMEVDVNPPGLFSTEAKFILHPIPFSIRSFSEPDLFAGKIHALLCRPWVKRVKGRDWYDFVWYIARKTPVNLLHLEQRLIQSKVWKKENSLDRENVINFLLQKAAQTDFELAKQDVFLFIKDSVSVSVWSNEFFKAIIEKITVL